MAQLKQPKGHLSGYMANFPIIFRKTTKESNRVIKIHSNPMHKKDMSTHKNYILHSTKLMKYQMRDHFNEKWDLRPNLLDS